MIVAFSVGLVYLVMFVRMYPQYWFAGALFMIIAVVGIIRRIAVMRGVLPANRAAATSADANAGNHTHSDAVE